MPSFWVWRFDDFRDRLIAEEDRAEWSKWMGGSGLTAQKLEKNPSEGGARWWQGCPIGSRNDEACLLPAKSKSKTNQKMGINEASMIKHYNHWIKHPPQKEGLQYKTKTQTYEN